MCKDLAREVVTRRGRRCFRCVNGCKSARCNCSLLDGAAHGSCHMFTVKVEVHLMNVLESVSVFPQTVTVSYYLYMRRTVLLRLLMKSTRFKRKTTNQRSLECSWCPAQTKPRPPTLPHFRQCSKEISTHIYLISVDLVWQFDRISQTSQVIDMRRQRLLGSDWLFSFGCGGIVWMPLVALQGNRGAWFTFTYYTFLMYYCQDTGTILSKYDNQYFHKS